MNDAPDNTSPEARRQASLWKPGQSGNPGGRPRKLVEIERMLDAEHRTVEQIREAFLVLRKLALQGVTNDVFFEGVVVGSKTEFSAAFMDLYLNRLLGKVPDSEVIEAEVQRRLHALLAEAEEMARRRKAAIDAEVVG